MKYVKTIKFKREFVIEAQDAAEANSKLDELVDKAEFDADIKCDGYCEFEDEEPETE